MARMRVVPQDELEQRIAISREISRAPAPHVDKLPLWMRVAIIVGGATGLWGALFALAYALIHHAH